MSASQPNSELSPTFAQQIDRASDEFESEWKSESRPRIEDYLAELTEPSRSQLLRELLLVEWQLRLRSGESPTAEDYLPRFPEHTDLIHEIARHSETRLVPRAQDADSVSVLCEPASTVDWKSPRKDVSRDDTLPNVPGYEILGVLGRGGMGVVYQARDEKLKRHVALKMIRGGAADDEHRHRFRVEAEAIARLQHPHIVQVHAVGEHAGEPFVVLEFVDGGSLSKRINGTPLPPREAAQIVETLARAMQVAHDRDILHRDLKPANVLMTVSGVPKITDFGLAKKLEDDSGQTQTGDVMGTPSYMSPEQAAGRTNELGPATDIYALGAILYELLTGRPPFKAATPVETLRQVIDDEPVAPSQLNPAANRDVETVCLKSLSKSPSRRYATARDMADDLRRWLHGEPITARPVGQTERLLRWCQRNPIVASLIATAALLLIAVAVISRISASRLKELVEQKGNETKRANQETSRAIKLANDNATLAKQEQSARLKADELTAKEREARIRAENLAKLWMADVHRKEGDEGVTQLPINIVLPEAQNKVVTLNVHTIDGTATAGVDYVATSGTVTFQADQRGIVTVNVQILGDRVKEQDEEFYLRITNSSVNVATATARIRILDDDSPPQRIDSVTPLVTSTPTPPASEQSSRKGPTLITPLADAKLSSGTKDLKTPHSWEFDWEDVPNATKYQLHVMRSGATKPVIDHNEVRDSKWKHTTNSYSAYAKGRDWRWRVRAFVNGAWSDWSEERAFDVEESKLEPTTK